MRRWEDDGTAALDGNEAIRALRKAKPGLGIVAHGERPERHLANSALQAGASAYLARTAEADLLMRAVRPRSRRKASSTRRCRRPAAAAS